MRWSGEEIRVTTSSGSDPPAPADFVWRGRSYAVLQVLEFWRARPDWWRDLLAVDGAAGTGPGPAGFSAADLEERVWRVSASPRRARGRVAVERMGVYELGHARTWRLLRISD